MILKHPYMSERNLNLREWLAVYIVRSEQASEQTESMATARANARVGLWRETRHYAALLGMTTAAAVAEHLAWARGMAPYVVDGELPWPEAPRGA